MSGGNGIVESGCGASCLCGKNDEPLFLDESAANSSVAAPTATTGDSAPTASQVPSGDSAPEFGCAPAAENQLCDCGKQKVCDCK